jgi:hypothetical protein
LETWKARQPPPANWETLAPLIDNLADHDTATVSPT